MKTMAEACEEHPELSRAIVAILCEMDRTHSDWGIITGIAAHVQMQVEGYREANDDVRQATTGN